MHKTMEGILHYHGYHGCRSFCHIRVYEGRSETGENGGNGDGKTTAPPVPPVPPVLPVVIATQIYRLLERPEAGITVIEHYVEHDFVVSEDRAFVGGRATIKETFDLVTFTWTSYQGAIDPRWTPMKKEQVEEILGGPLLAREISSH